jgi:hypothetical protein
MYRYIMTSVVSPELDYATKQISHPTYQFTRFLPQSSVGVVLSAVGGDTIFEIPP